MDNSILDSNLKEYELATKPLIRLCELESTTLPQFVSGNGFSLNKSSVQDDELAVVKPTLTSEVSNSQPALLRQVQEH
jgi:hypothetical protein